MELKKDEFLILLRKTDPGYHIRVPSDISDDLLTETKQELGHILAGLHAKDIVSNSTDDSSILTAISAYYQRNGHRTDISRDRAVLNSLHQFHLLPSGHLAYLMNGVPYVHLTKKTALTVLKKIHLHNDAHLRPTAMTLDA